MSGSTWVVNVVDEAWMRERIAEGIERGAVLAVHIVKGSPRPTLRALEQHLRPAPLDRSGVTK